MQISSLAQSEDIFMNRDWKLYYTPEVTLLSPIIKSQQQAFISKRTLANNKIF